MIYAMFLIPIALTVGVGLLAVFLVHCLYLNFFGAINTIPGPSYTKFTSLVYKYYSIKGLRVKYIHSLHEKYGPAVRVAPDEVSISDLSAVREIHRVASPYNKSNWYYEVTGGHRSDLFTTPDPSFHRTRRSLLAQPLSETGLRPMETLVNKSIQKAIEGIALEGSQLEGAVDIFKWFTYMATDIIGELSFSESFQMLDRVVPNQYFYDLKTFAILGKYRAELGKLTYVLGALQIDPFARALSVVNRLKVYAEQSFARYEKHLKDNPDNPKATLFTKLVSKQEGQLANNEIIGEGMSYIVAGSDTLAVATTFLVYNVCKDPAVRAKLIAEVAQLPANFGWEDVQDLQYLNNVIQETLRLCSPAPGSLKRDVPRSGAVLAGYVIPSGYVVSTQCYTLHRNPSIFSDPEKFDPDRWTNPTIEMNHSFMAFGGGSRVCLGLHLARHEIQMAAASFFRRFPAAQIIESDEGMDQEAYFLMAPRAHKCMADLGLGEKA